MKRQLFYSFLISIAIWGMLMYFGSRNFLMADMRGACYSTGSAPTFSSVVVTNNLTVNGTSSFSGDIRVNNSNINMDTNQVVSFGTDTMTSNAAEFVFNNDVLATNLLTTGSLTASGSATIGATSTVTNGVTCGGGYGATGLTVSTDGDLNTDGFIRSENGIMTTNLNATGTITSGSTGSFATGTFSNGISVGGGDFIVSADGDITINGYTYIDDILDVEQASYFASASFSSNISAATGVFTGLNVGSGNFRVSSNGDVNMAGKLNIDGDIDPVNYYGSGFVAATEGFKADYDKGLTWAGAKTLTANDSGFVFNDTISTIDNMAASGTLTVGGIATMSSTLNVNGAAGIVIDSNPTTGNTTNYLYGGENAGDDLQLYANNKDTNVNRGYLLLQSGNHLYINTPNNYDMYFTHAGDPLLSLDRNGNVMGHVLTSSVTSGSGYPAFTIDTNTVTSATATLMTCNALTSGTCNAMVVDESGVTSGMAYSVRLRDSGARTFAVNPFGNVDASGTLSVAGNTTMSNTLTVNDTNNDNAIYAQATGSSFAVYAYTESALTQPGDFYINNASNNKPAVQGNTSGSGQAVYGLNTGTGYGGHFSITNNANSLDALYVTNAGLGNAAHFLISYASSNEPLIYGNNVGSGMLLDFDSNSIDKFSVNTEGNVAASGTLNIGATSTFATASVTLGLVLTEMAEPQTPVANTAVIFLDTTSNNLLIKWDDGTLSTISSHP